MNLKCRRAPSIRSTRPSFVFDRCPLGQLPSSHTLEGQLPGARDDGRCRWFEESRERHCHWRRRCGAPWLFRRCSLVALSSRGWLVGRMPAHSNGVWNTPQRTHTYIYTHTRTPISSSNNIKINRLFKIHGRINPTN